MSTAARRIISYCLTHRIGNIVVGCNPDWKQSIHLSEVTNQNFVQIPHGKLREKLAYLCELYGIRYIRYIEKEESYTSKASFFDDDALPVYNTDNPQSYDFSGRRITRGQYKTASGYVFNADINGALNILRKSKLVNLRVLQDRGCVSQPQRARLYGANFAESPAFANAHYVAWRGVAYPLLLLCIHTNTGQGTYNHCAQWHT